MKPEDRRRLIQRISHTEKFLKEIADDLLAILEKLEDKPSGAYPNGAFAEWHRAVSVSLEEIRGASYAYISSLGRVRNELNWEGEMSIRKEDIDEPPRNP